MLLLLAPNSRSKRDARIGESSAAAQARTFAQLIVSVGA
jgi:hypothetical protein